MSYYESNYYQQPPAPYGPRGDFNMPVPGWGTRPIAAGPARIGIGGFGANIDLPLTPGMQQNILQKIQIASAQGQADCANAGGTVDPASGRCVLPSSGGFPWWGWVAGAAVLGVGAAVAVNRKWI